MANPLVLTIGGTSRNVAKLLFATGRYAVRMGARDPSRIAASFEDQGAEAVAVNSTLDSMRAALQRASLLRVPDLSAGAGDVLVQKHLQALKEKPTVAHVVYLSVMNMDEKCTSAAPDEDFEMARKHYLNEELLVWRGVPYTVLRPTWFHENLIA